VITCPVTLFGWLESSGVHDELAARVRQPLTVIAAAANVGQGVLAYGNCFLASVQRVKPGCRSLVVVTNNLFLHAHNLDWDNLGGLGRWTT
jgi:hypothetical protein